MAKQDARELYAKKDKQKGVARYFYALRQVRMDDCPNAAYQIEVIALDGTKVVHQEMWDKPDTKEMVLAKLQELMDPNAEMENLYATNYITA